MLLDQQWTSSDFSPLSLCYETHHSCHNHCHIRSMRKLCLLKKLVGTTWGADTNILRRVYTGAVHPIMDMEYATTFWATASNANMSKLVFLIIKLKKKADMTAIVFDITSTHLCNFTQECIIFQSPFHLLYRYALRMWDMVDNTDDANKRSRHSSTPVWGTSTKSNGKKRSEMKICRTEGDKNQWPSRCCGGSGAGSDTPLGIQQPAPNAKPRSGTCRGREREAGLATVGGKTLKQSWNSKGPTGLEWPEQPRTECDGDGS